MQSHLIDEAPYRVRATKPEPFEANIKPAYGSALRVEIAKPGIAGRMQRRSQLRVPDLVRPLPVQIEHVGSAVGRPQDQRGV